MQKLLNALVAMMSFAGVLSGLSVSPVTAQDRTAPVGPDETAPGVENTADTKPMVLPPGVIHDDVEVRNRPLIIEGDVKGSVHAINSRVTLMPGALVEGTLSIQGGSLAAPAGANGVTAGIISNGPGPTGNRSPAEKKGSWLGGQFCLLLLGLLGGGIVLLTAPAATARATDTISMHPGRSLLAGAIAAAGMFSALAVSGLIVHSRTFFSVIWMPILIVVALLSLSLLVFGWLAGMRRVGDLVAQRLGQTGSGTFYGRMAYGLGAFFLVNSILGVINPALGAAGLLVDFAIAVMGVGAVIQSGFRSEDPWRSSHAVHGGQGRPPFSA